MGPVEQDSYQSRLTSLYYEANHLCNNVAWPSQDLDAPELLDLQSRFHYQKDRLLTWGEKWGEGDANATAQGGIGDPTAQAESTEIVRSVLSHVKDLLNQAEEIQRSLASSRTAPIPSVFPQDKTVLDGGNRWATLSKALYEDLVKDFALSIDTLYDLARARESTTDARSQSIKEGASGVVSIQHDVVNTAGEHDERNQANHADVYTGQMTEISSESVFLVEERLLAYEGMKAAACSKFVAKLSNKPVMVDYVPSTTRGHSPGLSSPFRINEVGGYCNANNNSRLPTENVLRWLGYFDEPKKSRVGVVYELPRTVFGESSLEKRSWQDFRATSLEHILQLSSRSTSIPNTEPRISTPALEVRFRLALQLAQTLRHVHERSYFFGNIKSSSIVFFNGQNTSSSASIPHQHYSNLRQPFLCPLSFPPSTLGPLGGSELNIYLHPDAVQRDLSKAENGLQSRFDIYSLGLILLEVGLWLPLHSLFKPEYSLDGFKRRLQGTYIRHKLPGICGTVYTQVVQDCLSATAASPELYSNIVAGLAKCSMLDEAEGLHVPLTPLRIPNASGGRVFQAPAKQVPDFRDVRRKVVFLQKLWRRIYARKVMRRNQQRRKQSRKMLLGPHKCPAERCPFHKAGFATELERDRHYDDRHVSSSLQHSCRYGGCQYKSKKQSNVVEHMQCHHSQGPQSNPGVLDGVRQAPDLVTCLQEGQNIFPPLDLSSQQIHDWHRKILPCVGRIVDRVLGSSKESSSISLVAMGSSRSDAKPTLLVECKSISRIKSALCRELDLPKIGYDLKVLKGKVCRSMASQYPPDSPHQMQDDEASSPKNAQYQRQPVCGASIGAYTGEHLPAASFGGVVLVDDEPYGMTVHHMLDAPSDSEEDESDDDCDTDGDIEKDIAQRSGVNTHTRKDESQVGDAQSEISWAKEERLCSDTENETSVPCYDDGDSPGVEKDFGELLRITQPAIDDADDGLFPDPEDRDDDHLASHELGYVHASSGIRRWKVGSEVHEVDWALMKIHDNRLQRENVVSGGRRHCVAKDVATRSGSAVDYPGRRKQIRAGQGEDLYPTEVARADELGTRPVHCLGRTSGLQTGVISPAMSYVRMRGRSTSSFSWCVVGDFGVGGDSGAWVIDNMNGQVCGHVLARSSRTNITYIGPMQLMLEDMRRSLDAKCVCLPGGTPKPLSLASEGTALVNKLEGLMGMELGLDLPDIAALDLGDVRRSRDKDAKDSWSGVHSTGVCGFNHPLAPMCHQRQAALG